MLLLGIAIAAFCLLPQFTAGESHVALDSLLASRVEGCAVCERMARDVLPGQFLHDAHRIACGECHHPHVQHTAEEWMRRCTSPECHPQAWTRSIFHRVDPEVFTDCTNCHHPHVWKADGRNCLSCHANIRGPEGNVAAAAVRGTETWRNVPRATEDPKATLFSHERHSTLDCALCHQSKTTHAELVQNDAATCMECHHGPEARVSCSACHAGEVARSISHQETLQLTVWNAPQRRTLAFEHSRHQAYRCEQCHRTPGSARVVACGSCHEQHHRAEANCVTCHAEPREGVHPMAVHTTRTCTGSGCHTQGMSAIPDERNFCLVCHRDMTDHNADRNCTACHVMPRRDLFAPHAAQP